MILLNNTNQYKKNETYVYKPTTTRKEGAEF